MRMELTVPGSAAKYGSFPSHHRLLIVSFAERGDRIRIISARELTRAKRRAYKEETHE